MVNPIHLSRRGDLRAEVQVCSGRNRPSPTTEDFVHLEHIDLVRPKYCFHGDVTQNLASVFGILEVIALDVIP